MKKCPDCGGTKVFFLRIDSDWCYGLGEYYPVNNKEEYTEEEFEMDACSRPDIELFHCRSCHKLW